jgi:hypothetical protein
VETAAILVIAALIYLWGAMSARLERADLSAPIVFVAVGAVLAGVDLFDSGTPRRRSNRWSRSPSSGCCSPTRHASGSRTFAPISDGTSGCWRSACR